MLRMVRTGKVSKKFTRTLSFIIKWFIRQIFYAKPNARLQDIKIEKIRTPPRPTYTHRCFEVRGPVMNYIN